MIIVINGSFNKRYYGHNSVCKLFFPSELPLCVLINTDLSTASDGKFFKRSDIINQQVHKSQLVTESHQDVQSRGVEGYAVALLLEFFILLQWTAGWKLKLSTKSLLSSICRVMWRILRAKMENLAGPLKWKNLLGHNYILNPFQSSL